MAITLAIVNRKGGVGKSTSCISLGGALARAGRRVLVIDFDPQATLTTGLLGAAATDALPADATGAALFGNNFVPPERLIVPTRFEGLSLLPGSPALDEFNASRPSEDGAGQFVLRDFLADLGGMFDRVLIDCPPNLYALSAAAMTAAQYALVPTKADPDGAAALKFVNAEVTRIQTSTNPDLRLLGYLLGLHKPRNGIHAGYALSLRQGWPTLLMDGFLPDAAVFVEARRQYTPVSFYRARSAAAKAVAAVAEEIERRMVGAESVKEAA